MIEDTEIISRFAYDKVEICEAYPLAAAVAEAIPAIKLVPSSGERRILGSELVGQKRELWPVYYLLPGGGCMH